MQPGVAGAFLGDTASAVYSGAPTVTSVGFARLGASVAGSPYPIIVGLGSFAVFDNYALVLDSAGRLTIDPLPLTYAVADALVIGDGYGFAANDGLLLGASAPFRPRLPARPDADQQPGGRRIRSRRLRRSVAGFLLVRRNRRSLPDPNRFADPEAALRAISHALDNYFKRCENPTQATIADALDAYAAKLQVLAPRLPPALRNVPAIIAEGARRVRAARSRTEAVAVLHQTVAAVHKEIALVLSEDPQTRSREVRDGDVIAGALGGASVALVNSGGL